MEIEADILPVQTRLNQKCRLYALRTTTFLENHQIRQRIPHSYPPESNIGEEVQENKYLDWDQKAGSDQRTNKRHPTQLIRILSEVLEWIPPETDLNNFFLKVP